VPVQYVTPEKAQMSMTFALAGSLNLALKYEYIYGFIIQFSNEFCKLTVHTATYFQMLYHPN